MLIRTQVNVRYYTSEVTSHANVQPSNLSSTLGNVRYYALTYSLHTCVGSSLTQIAPHLDQVIADIFRYIRVKVLGWISTSVLRPATLRLRRASSTFPWLGRLALPCGSTALTQDERYRRYHRDLL